MKNPWFKFYPSDWRSDEELRNCSAAARGLWVEMLCLMHKAKPYGHLLINGDLLTDTQLSMQTGIPESQIVQSMHELEKAGVFSRNEKGVPYSRKMVRDEQKSNTAKNYGKKGGNPSLKGKVKGQHKPQNPSPDPEDINPPLPPNGKNFNGYGYDILNSISEDGLMDARSQAPGWDIQGHLVPIYNTAIREGKMEKPRYPNKAFPAWCKSYTKGKRA